MKDQIEFLAGIIRSATRFRWAGLLTTTLVVIVGMAAVLALPNTFQSRAQIYVDTRSVLRPLLQGLAVSPQTQDQTDAVRRALLARPSLDAVARKTGLYGGTDVSAEMRDRRLMALSDQISIHGDSTSGFYTITYTNHSTEKARLVVQTLLDTFVEASVGAGQTDTANAQKFFKQQVDEYERRLSESESRLAEFKKKNVGLMPDQRGDYFVRLQTELSSNDKTRMDLAVAERQRDSLRRKISGEAAPATNGSSAPVAMPTAGEVQEATALDAKIRDTRRQLNELLLKFTDKHPEVIATRAVLVRLEAQRHADLGGVVATNGTSNETSSAPVDPVIQNLQIALNTVDLQVSSLQAQLAQSDSRVGELRRLVTTGPEIEAELVRLNRDYGVTKAQYEALLQRFETARLSSDATRSEELRFKVLEQPRAELTPISPNRRMLLAAVMVAGIFCGVAVAVLLSLVQPVFLSRKTLASATGLPVIGVVRLAKSPIQVATDRRQFLAFAACTLLLVGTVAVVGVLNYPASRFVGSLLGSGVS